nr:Lrp/AsnC ligand binding domain-containing protein [Sphingomonas liriopis]
MIGIDADPPRVSALAKELSDIPEIGCVIVLLGRYSLLAMTLMTSVEALSDLVTDRIRPLAGVRRVETSVSVHNLKYEAGVAKIAQVG